MGRRAEQLLALLGEDEIAEIRGEIAAMERPSLLNLYDLLVATRGEGGESEALFAAAFGREWSRKEDYLLRNELRLLSERCYGLIARRENERDMERNRGRYERMLLRGLLERRAFKVFEHLCGKFCEGALRRLDYATAFRLNEIRFDYLIRYREITPEGMERTREILLENLEYLKRAYRNDLSENQHQRVVTEQNLLAMGRMIETTGIGPDFDFSDHETPLSRFHDRISLAHASRGEDRVEYARDAFREIEPAAEYLPAKALFGYAILASALYADLRYEEAISVFGDGLDFARRHALNLPPEMLFNYAGTLMRIGSYDQVLELLDRYHAEFASRPKLRFRSECFRCFCHIFLGDPAAAFQAIPPDISRRAESEHNYFRFIYLILPYLNHDPEGALREARNFLVYFNRNRERLQFPQEKKMAMLYRAFYSVTYNEPDPQRRRKGLARIRREIETFVENEPEYRDYLYVRWLDEEIAKRGGTKK